MSTLWAAGAAFSALWAGQPLPDQLDILRGADTTPQIALVLDSSCSMGWDPAPSVCTHYPNAQTTLRGSYQSGGTWYLSRVDQLKAALTGCRSASDGILDAWASRVLFSVSEFGGGRTGLLSPFDPSLANLAALETAVMNLPASGGTPLAPAYRNAALYFDSFFNDANTAQCRQNYIVLMSDGVGNSGDAVSFDFVTGNTPITVRDANYCFGNVTSGCPSPPYPDEAARYLFENDSGGAADVLSNVGGTQPIRTYTIGFQAPTAADELLNAMAARGDGKAFTATSYEQLSAAFSEIISSIVARSRVAFNVGSVQTDGLFSGNYIYSSTFRPVEDGHWLGTTKKFCVFPGPGATNCLFVVDSASGDFFINSHPQDLWSGNNAIEANAGGSGEVMVRNTFGVSNTADEPPSNPLGRRTLLTWRSGQSGYVSVHPDQLTGTDTWTGETCKHHALVNSMHGFSEQVEDCSAGDLGPAAFDNWPIGDTVHGGTLLLQYSKTCESSGDKCFVATVANDGMLHFYNARTGEETSAIVPAELWRPNTIAHHTLTERDDQPSLETTRRYYFDGQLYLHHVDEDGDGTIDPDEEAALIAGLGRGGRGYYLFNVNRFDGVPTDADNPPRPLLADETTGFRDLQDTWAAPWTGLMEIAPGAQATVAVFPSGHLAELDDPSIPFGDYPGAASRASRDREASPHSVSCADLGIPPDVCQTPDPGRFCADLGLSCGVGDPCDGCPLADDTDCQLAGYTPPYCYDWPGFGVLPPTTNIWVQTPLDLAVGPYRYEVGNRKGIAYRIRFSRLDLQSGDYLAIFDGDGTEVGRLSGSATGTTSVASPWIYSESFTFRIVTDGVNDADATGYAIDQIEVIRDAEPAAPAEIHRPTIFVVDINRWNSGTDGIPPFSGSEPGLFEAPPVASDSRQAGALRVRITSECTGVEGNGELCIDQSTSPDTSDLRWMVCPISAQPSVYTEGGLLRTIYVGDECGQIWSANQDVTGAWKVRRLLHLNATDGSGFTVSGSESKDYRKIFRRLDLVVSACPGQRAIGVYFGSGNIQRPAAKDALADSSVRNFGGSVYGADREVVGVLWDTDFAGEIGLADLTNVTNLWKIDNPSHPSNQRGWYIELDDQERMLRDPLVFDGVAYYDVYHPVTDATECFSAIGESRTLVMDNCTAEPLPATGGGTTPNEARTTAQRSESSIGGGFLVITPLGEKPIISLGQETTGRAALPTKDDRPNLRLFLWRP